MYIILHNIQYKRQSENISWIQTKGQACFKIQQFYNKLFCVNDTLQTLYFKQNLYLTIKTLWSQFFARNNSLNKAPSPALK